MQFTIYQGNTVAFTALPKVNGDVVDIDGTIGFIMKIRKDDDDDDAVLSLTSTDGEFTIDADTTTDIPKGVYHYEFRWYFSDAVYTLSMGMVTVTDTVYD